MQTLNEEVSSKKQGNNGCSPQHRDYLNILRVPEGLHDPKLQRQKKI